MIKLDVTCLYCGNHWQESVWSTSNVNIWCKNCKETKNIKIKEVYEKHGNDVFGYRFSPAFPEKKEEPINIALDMPSWKSWSVD